MTYKQYQEIVKANTPNWPQADINRLALDCWNHKLDEKATLEMIKTFL